MFVALASSEETEFTMFPYFLPVTRTLKKKKKKGESFWVCQRKQGTNAVNFVIIFFDENLNIFFYHENLFSLGLSIK